MCSAASHCLNNYLLLSKTALDNLAGRDIDNEMVGIANASNDRFSQPGIGINHRLLPLASQWVGCKEDSRCAGFHHALNDDRQVNRPRINVQTGTIAHRSISP